MTAIRSLEETKGNGRRKKAYGTEPPHSAAATTAPTLRAAVAKTMNMRWRIWRSAARGILLHRQRCRAKIMENLSGA
jgi:hypothetical protein